MEFNTDGSVKPSCLVLAEAVAECSQRSPWKSNSRDLHAMWEMPKACVLTVSPWLPLFQNPSQRVSFKLDGAR